jgi:uncharacterized membrane protein
MKPILSFIKTTALGGLIFLFPLVAVIIVASKAFGFMKMVAAPFEAMIPIDSVGGIALINVLAALGVVGVCILGGLAATRPRARELVRSIESKLLLLIPRYSILKAQLSGTLNEDGAMAAMSPVLVRMDEGWVVAFAHDDETAGRRTVFMPGAPDPWSGGVMHIHNSRIYPLDVDFLTVVKMLQRIGIDAKPIMEAIPEKE